jgi:hypothetical protein
MFGAGETVTLVSTTTTTDTVGDATTTTTETDWGPVAVWDRYATEQTDPTRPGVIVGLVIAGPRVAIDADDAIIRDGVRYELDGPPEENTVNPFTGWDPGITVNVKRTGDL